MATKEQKMAAIMKSYMGLTEKGKFPQAAEYLDSVVKKRLISREEGEDLFKDLKEKTQRVKDAVAAREARTKKDTNPIQHPPPPLQLKEEDSLVPYTKPAEKAIPLPRLELGAGPQATKQDSPLAPLQLPPASPQLPPPYLQLPSTPENLKTSDLNMQEPTSKQPVPEPEQPPKNSLGLASPLAAGGLGVAALGSGQIGQDVGQTERQSTSKGAGEQVGQKDNELVEEEEETRGITPPEENEAGEDLFAPAPFNAPSYTAPPSFEQNYKKAGEDYAYQLEQLGTARDIAEGKAREKLDKLIEKLEITNASIDRFDSQERKALAWERIGDMLTRSLGNLFAAKAGVTTPLQVAAMDQSQRYDDLRAQSAAQRKQVAESSSRGASTYTDELRSLGQKFGQKEQAEGVKYRGATEGIQSSERAAREGADAENRGRDKQFQLDMAQWQNQMDVKKEQARRDEAAALRRGDKEEAELIRRREFVANNLMGQARVDEQEVDNLGRQIENETKVLNDKNFMKLPEVRAYIKENNKWFDGLSDADVAAQYKQMKQNEIDSKKLQYDERKIKRDENMLKASKIGSLSPQEFLQLTKNQVGDSDELDMAKTQQRVNQMASKNTPSTPTKKPAKSDKSGVTLMLNRSGKPVNVPNDKVQVAIDEQGWTVVK
jgi:hypothetical protein